MSGEKNSFDNFEELYTNCYWLVYRYVRHMIEKDLAAAEDVTQEVFLVAYQKWQEVRRHPNQKGFLLLTAKNKLKKWYEQQGKIQTEGSGQEEKSCPKAGFRSGRILCTGRMERLSGADFFHAGAFDLEVLL